MTTNTDINRAEEETTNMRRALTLTEIGVIVSLLSTAAMGVFTLGVLYGQVQQNTARIEVIEPKVDQIESRIERIDANVAFLAELAREERNRR